MGIFLGVRSDEYVDHAGAKKASMKLAVCFHGLVSNRKFVDYIKKFGHVGFPAGSQVARKLARHPSPPVLQSSLPVELQWPHTVLNEPSYDT